MDYILKDCDRCEGSGYRPVSYAEASGARDHSRCPVCNGEGTVEVEDDTNRIVASGSGSAGGVNDTDALDRPDRSVSSGDVARAIARADEVDGLANALVKMGVADTKDHALTALRRQLR